MWITSNTVTIICQSKCAVERDSKVLNFVTVWQCDSSVMNIIRVNEFKMSAVTNNDRLCFVRFKSTFINAFDDVVNFTVHPFYSSVYISWYEMCVYL